MSYADSMEGRMYAQFAIDIKSVPTADLLVAFDNYQRIERDSIHLVGEEIASRAPQDPAAQAFLDEANAVWEDLKARKIVFHTFDNGDEVYMYLDPETVSAE